MSDNREMNPIGAMELQRLVDGSLSLKERRELFARCENLSGGWRQVAFAFIEEQILREGLQQQYAKRSRPVVAPPVIPSLSNDLAAAESAIAQSHRSVATDNRIAEGKSSIVDGNPTGTILAQRRGQNTRQLVTMMAIAAAWLITLTVALLIGMSVDRGNEINSDSSVATSTYKNNQNDEKSAPKVEQIPFSPTMAETSELAGYGMDDLSNGSTQLTDAIRYSMLKAGYLVKANPEFLPAEDVSGQPVRVQIPNYEVHYVGGMAYQ